MCCLWPMGPSSLLSEEEYKRLDYPQTIEALCTRAVVQSETTNPFDSHMKQIELTLPLSEELATPLRDEILFLSFHVESPRGEEAVVTINGMKNKLSSKKAPYPNKNYTFTYILSSGAETDRLKIGLSEGNYTLSDLTGYTLKTEHMKHEGISVPETEAIEKDGKTVFSGSIGMQENGYFITSYPYRQGYRVLVDGKETEPEKVNTAFLGFPLTAGNHSIEIIYIAPGFQTGLTISGLSLLGLALLIIIERKKTK